MTSHRGVPEGTSQVASCERVRDGWWIGARSRELVRSAAWAQFEVLEASRTAFYRRRASMMSQPGRAPGTRWSAVRTA